MSGNNQMQVVVAYFKQLPYRIAVRTEKYYGIPQSQ